MGNVNDTKIPKTLVKSIVDHINPKLVKAYEEHVAIASYVQKFEDYAEGILLNIIEDSKKENVRTIKGVELGNGTNTIMALSGFHRSQTNRKKDRWYKGVIKNLEKYKPGEKGYPFPELAGTYAELTEEQWKLTFKNLGYKEVVDQRVAQLKEWAISHETLFLDYPLYAQVTPRRKEISIGDDVTTEIYRILRDFYHYNINDFLRPVMDNGEVPVFSASKQKISKPSDNQYAVEDVPMDETGEENHLLIRVNKEAFGVDSKVLLSDAKDQEIVMYILKEAMIRPDSSYVEIMIGHIAKDVYKYPSIPKTVYEDVLKRLQRIAHFYYDVFREGKYAGTIHYVNDVKIREDGLVQITLGSTISDAIMNNKIRRISSYDYDKLEVPSSKLMYIHLQRERIQAHFGKQLVKEYYYTRFLSWVNFGSPRNKKKNISAIQEALAEFQKQKVMIDHFEFSPSTNIFTIHFIPFSHAEEVDINLLGYNMAMSSGEGKETLAIDV